MIERDKVTHFAAVPTMYLTMLNHPDRAKYDLSSLRMCGSGGAPIPVETLDTWKRHYNFQIHEGYGLTETSPTATWSQGPITPKAGSCGKPIWGCQIKIVDDNGNTLPPGKEGEVLIRGVNVMKGYYKQPEATAQILKNGWFYSGDIGKLDEEGYLYIVGRKKDMILRGGFNIYPREIEELLYEHPAVAEAAVVGVKHDELGEEIKAVVYLKPGCTATRRRDPGLLQGADRGLQVSADRRDSQRAAAQGPLGQDSQARIDRRTRAGPHGHDALIARSASEAHLRLRHSSAHPANQESTTMAYEEILYDVSDRIATITLNRPTKLNAWTPQDGAGSRSRPCRRRARRPGARDHPDRRRPRVLRRRRHGQPGRPGQQSSGIGRAIKAMLSERFNGPRREGARPDFQKTYSYFPADRQADHRRDQRRGGRPGPGDLAVLRSCGLPRTRPSSARPSRGAD